MAQGRKGTKAQRLKCTKAKMYNGAKAKWQIQ